MVSALQAPPKAQYLTHPDCTRPNVPSIRLRILARRFADCYATAELREFDILIPVHLNYDNGVNRLLKKALAQDWRYEFGSKLEILESRF